jgi:hypothetical protein
VTTDAEDKDLRDVMREERAAANGVLTLKRNENVRKYFEPSEMH